MLTKCANCKKEIDRPKWRAMKGNCYCDCRCQMEYEYKTGKRDPYKTTDAAHDAVRLKSELRFEDKPNIRIGKRGYKLIYIPIRGWIKYHHYIWEKNYGRIPEGMVIHHINGDRLDNRIENLQMMSNSAHIKLHWKTSGFKKNQIEKQREAQKNRKRNNKGQYL
jgi:hypothetical protein